LHIKTDQESPKSLVGLNSLQAVFYLTVKMLSKGCGSAAECSDLWRLSCWQLSTDWHFLCFSTSSAV